MSSFGRAERRRQAREAAKTSDRVDQRGSADSMRAAVATYLERAYDVTPELDGLAPETFYDEWEEWFEGRGLTMQLFSWAPGHLRRWIAIVERGGSMHAVVMSGTALYHDPAPEGERADRIDRADIMGALVIGDREDRGWLDRIADEGERGFAAGDPRLWRLERLLESTWAVQIYRARGESDRAAAMKARLQAAETDKPAAPIELTEPA